MGIDIECCCATALLGDPGGQGGDPFGGTGHHRRVEDTRLDGGDDVGVGHPVGGGHLQIEAGVSPRRPGRGPRPSH